MTTLPRLARLHLLTLASFAVAQPLYDLIGQHTEFLVAHGARPGVIVAMILVLSLGVGLVFVAVVELTRLLGPRAGIAAHFTTVGILGALIAAGPARGWPATVAIPASTAAGIALAAAYLARPVRTFLTILTPSIAIFPLIFVLATPVARLMREAPTVGGRATLRAKPPIVVVVFDEFSTFDMIDSSGAIDRRQYPSMAALADTSTWFPNAVSPYPYTERAIPAMLTGVAADGSDTRLPIAADHPNNLFTWLGDSYRLHVSEPVSALCPEEACTSEATVAKATAVDLVVDTGILYLHLIVPRDIAERRLPSVAGTWKRFMTGGGAHVASSARPKTFDVIARFERASQPGRDLLFRNFVEGIDRDRQPTFHFIHVLLPHDPYVFTSTGRRYSVGGLTEGMDPSGVWTTQQPLVDTGRRRHAAQARFSDKLLGELVAKLQAQQIFDEALLIVTADHGAAFKPGESHRGMTASNATEIIPVPMLIKLPGQRTAAVNERAVSGLDIAPTIAAALNTSVPWPHDGRAMLADQYPARSTVTFPHAGVEPLPVIDVRTAAREGAFGLAAIAKTSALAAALPTLPDDITRLPLASGMRVFSENFAKLETVSSDGLLPALVIGEVQLDSPRAEPLTLAFVVNQSLASVTRTVRWAGSNHYFNVLLPDEVIRAGANRLDILLVRQSGGGPAVLERIADDFTRGLTLVERSSSRVITRRDGTEIRVGGRVTGSIDQAAEETEALKLVGWAADTASARPLRAIVAFSGGRAIAFTAPHAERPDVTAALGLRPGQRVSFALIIPRHAIAGSITVLGLSDGGEAGGLQTSPAIAALLQAPSKSSTRGR